jgi:hypothetical protein
MRDLVVALRGELKSLEAELAADPRLHKAQKIRELLALYGEPSQAPELGQTVLLSHRYAAVPALAGRRAKVNWLRSTILNFRRKSGSAAIARSRLIAMAQTNNWQNTSPAWLQLQMDATGRLLSYDNVLPPGSSAPSAVALTSHLPEEGSATVNARNGGSAVLGSRRLKHPNRRGAGEEIVPAGALAVAAS